MTKPYKKKLIEVAIPLEAINAASAREKSIRHGHPSTLHLWWARRPLAACRAVLFAQLVDDPSSRVDELMADPKLRAQAEAELPARVKAWETSKAAAKGTAAHAPEPTLEDVAAEIERKRLFAIIEDLVKWENSTNEEVLERARAEIRRSCGGDLPPVYDPFSGGGSIPLEAQRLGLPAYGSDLNPVAVMIGKAMIEIPAKFKDMPPIHPGIKGRSFYRNAEGLAEDVKYYGEWMREKAWERIGHLYPQVELPKEYGGGRATVVAWIWARTVRSPDPAFSDVQVPVTSSFVLSSKKGNEAWIEPVVDREAKSITYRVTTKGSKQGFEAAKSGTKAGRGSNFTCLMSGSAITMQHLRAESKRVGLGQTLVGLVVERGRSKVFVAPSAAHAEITAQASPVWRPETLISEDRRAFTPPDYGMQTFGDLFTNRQLVALNTFSDLVSEVRAHIEADAAGSHIKSGGIALVEGGTSAKAYAEAVSVFLAFGVSRASDFWNTGAIWESSGGFIAHLFNLQAIPIVWDFAEGNPFSSGTGSWSKTCMDWIFRVIEGFVAAADGSITQVDAQSAKIPQNAVISTDPPYYDNIPYADLSDFFYCWLRRSLRSVYPELTTTISVPKMEELVADRLRHGGAEKADKYFLSGMKSAIKHMVESVNPLFPSAIYYAFKQQEVREEGISSAGWSTFLQAIIESGFEVLGTWPVRTERTNRPRGIGSNALATSVVIVCRKQSENADTITRAEFIRALKRELPPAIAELQAANIAPADMQQSAIGPGMGVFSRYRAVLEADDSPMTVKTALQLINAELDEYLGGIQGEFDPDTRFAITWFEQNGMGKGDYGVADNLARARGISVDSVKHAGIVESEAGKVRLLKRDELDADWEPDADGHLTIWECFQHLVRQHEKDGIAYDTALLLKKIGEKAEAVKDLAYCLYDICANKRQDAKEATAYNALIADWTELTREAATIPDVRGDGQMRMEV